jgi:hypothetical protein
MSLFTTQFERVKNLVNKIKVLEDKLMSNAVLPMSKQHKIHAEIRQYKEEMAKLEKMTKK